MLEFSAHPVSAPSLPPVSAALTEIAPAAAPLDSEGDGNTLDFEFDLGALDAKTPSLAPLAATEPSAMTAEVPMLDEEAPQPSDGMSAQTSALDFNFDLLKPVDSFPQATLGAEQESVTGSDDAPQLPEASGALPADLSTLSPAPLPFDLSSINLDLGTPATPATSLPSLAEPEVGSGNAEMATKLDLALAYQEIGDAEGARELLEEVARGGTAVQVEKARSLMLKMA